MLHVGLIACANAGAFWLRFDGEIPDHYWQVFTDALPWLLAIRVVTFLPFRLFEGLWRYTSLWDLRNILLGVTTSSLVFALFWQLVGPPPGYPRSIYLIDALLLTVLLGGVRTLRRVYREFVKPVSARRVLIYGAGDAGELIVRDMRQNSAFDATAVGFVDDDRRKKGERIHGVPVLGSRNELTEIIARTNAEEVLIAIPSASPDVLTRIVRQLETHKVRINTLPRLADLVGKQVGVNQIRQLRVEDLLAREPIALDYGPVRAVLTGKRVVVTGAGGSIGSELCRQIAQAQPTEIVLLDRYENTLYEIANELSSSYPNTQARSVIADITDESRIDRIVSDFRPHVVFHAAAHKHVPLMEQNVCEAIKNNVRGTRIVAEAALRHGVERFVLISTDKAVNPTSVMGAAKRVAELLVKSLDASKRTRFVVVRFGNVLGSNGSVVPRFLSQIAKGGPVTVTHPEMRRYFMLIPEAVQLVLHAATIDDRDSIFVLEMGEQVRVVDMARDLIRLAGFVPDREIEIEFTGLRPGEKLYEELVGSGEEAEPSPIPKIMRVVERQASRPQMSAEIIELERAALDGRDELVIERLCHTVPSFNPQSNTTTLSGS